MRYSFRTYSSWNDISQKPLNKSSEYLKRTRQIIRYRATATLRRPPRTIQMFFKACDMCNPVSIVLKWSEDEIQTTSTIRRNFNQLRNINTARWESRNITTQLRKGPRSYLCTQVHCLAVKKWNRSILTESNIFVNASHELSEKNTPYFCWRLLWWKWGRKSHIFVHNSLIRKSF